MNGKRDFVHVTTLRILRWRNDSGLSLQAQCNHICPYNREAGCLSRQVMYTTGFQDGRKDQELRNADSFWKLKKKNE